MFPDIDSEIAQNVIYVYCSVTRRMTMEENVAV